MAGCPWSLEAGCEDDGRMSLVKCGRLQMERHMIHSIASDWGKLAMLRISIALRLLLVGAGFVSGRAGGLHRGCSLRDCCYVWSLFVSWFVAFCGQSRSTARQRAACMNPCMHTYINT
jgi:hypothetical protein